MTTQISRVKTFSQGVQTSINRGSLKKSEWIIENFKHPRNSRIPWSFIDHEFQIAIVDTPSPDSCIKKCAQVGLSELSIRESLSFCAMNDYRKMAYILPTAKFSSEFSSTRFDPAIATSSFVKSIISKDVDNTGVKKIGTCFLVMKGTSGTTSAISIDLDYLLCDEIDHCNQDVLGSFASRLQHSDLKITKDFSTPTVPDYGVSALYDISSQGRYRVRHSMCEQWVAPEFYTDVVIPGFDGPMADYRKEDRFLPGVKEAYINCPHCRNPIAWSDFTDPSRRSWVHAYPDRSKQGFQVVPWDVPKYNELQDVLFSIHRYKLHSDWVNFRLGLDHSSAENSFVEAVIKSNTSGKPSTLSTIVGSGYNRVFIGADLGKTSWIIIGIPVPSGLRIVCAESVKVASLPNASLGAYLVKLYRRLVAQRIIVDAAPNYETAMHLCDNLYSKQAYGAYFSGPKQSLLDIYSFNDDKGIVTMDRDASFDALAKAVNSGEITFCEPTEFNSKGESVLLKHLMAMKKVETKTNKGSIVKWTSTGGGEDHFAFALNYLYTAYASVLDRHSPQIVMGPSLSKVKIKETHD